MRYTIHFRSRNPLRRQHVRKATHHSDSPPEEFRRRIVAEYGRTNKRVLLIEVDGQFLEDWIDEEIKKMGEE